jgi:transcriptional regulator with XRE-family HTH domain
MTAVVRADTLALPLPDASVDAVMAPRAEAPATWETRLHGTIVSRTRVLRHRRNMSAQRLAERTAELGMAIPRAVLANLESGRKTNVTVAELLILARALGVGPADLLIPAGRDGQLEIAPGEFRSPQDVAWWFCSLRCQTCDDEPPAGFTCDTCGKSGSHAPAQQAGSARRKPRGGGAR